MHEHRPSPIQIIDTEQHITTMREAREWRHYRQADMQQSVDVGEGVKHAEELRMECAVRMLCYLRNGRDEDYRLLTGMDREDGGQSEERRLRQASFDFISQQIRELTPDQESFEALSYIMLIHDVMKRKSLLERLATNDHDEAIKLLFSEPRKELEEERYPDKEEGPVVDPTELRNEILPSFRSLTPRQQEIVSRTFRLGVNWGSIMQSQTNGHELGDFYACEDAQIRGMSFWHGIIDIAGSAGHIDPNYSIVLNEGTAENVVDTANAFVNDLPQAVLKGNPLWITGDGKLRNVYYHHLRAERLDIKQFMSEFRPDINLTLWDLQSLHFDHMAVIHYASVVMEQRDQFVSRFRTGEYDRVAREPDADEWDSIQRQKPLPSQAVNSRMLTVSFCNMGRYSSFDKDKIEDVVLKVGDLPVEEQELLAGHLYANYFDKNFNPDYVPALFRALQKYHPDHSVALTSRIVHQAFRASVPPLGEENLFLPEVLMIELRDIALQAQKPGFDPEAEITGVLNRHTNSIAIQIGKTATPTPTDES